MLNPPANEETATGVVAVSKGKETENTWFCLVAAMIEVCLERALQSKHPESCRNDACLEQKLQQSALGTQL